MKEESKNIQSVQRAIDIINCIGAAGSRITLREISAKLELNINTARGLAQTLLANGYLSRDEESGSYTLGYEFLTKSKQVQQLHVQWIREIAHPHMQRIAAQHGISCWLQISFYRDIYTVETVEAPGGHYSYVPRSGANLPLHASASGKLRIAHMPDQERAKVLDRLVLEPLTEHTITDTGAFAQAVEQALLQGYATELEEADLGIGSVAVSFFDGRQALIGTLSVVAPSAKLKRIMNEVVVDLKRSCTRITAAVSAQR